MLDGDWSIIQEFINVQGAAGHKRTGGAFVWWDNVAQMWCALGQSIVDELVKLRIPIGFKSGTTNQ